MVVRVGAVKVTWFKGSIKIKEDPRTTGSFTFQGMVIPGSVEVVVNKGDTRVVKVAGTIFCSSLVRGREDVFIHDLSGV